jgi:hypothetical protein
VCWKKEEKLFKTNGSGRRWKGSLKMAVITRAYIKMKLIISEEKLQLNHTTIQNQTPVE